MSRDRATNHDAASRDSDADRTDAGSRVASDRSDAARERDTDGSDATRERDADGSDAAREHDTDGSDAARAPASDGGDASGRATERVDEAGTLDGPLEPRTEPLADHTWLKIGGTADLVVPGDRDELVAVLRACHERDRDYRILGNGSNLLVADEGVDELVIKTTEACGDLDVGEDGVVRAGASVAVPQFANVLVQHGLGGYEYLYSVPGTIGGAVYMNAGRGRRHDQTISDYLREVEVFDGEAVRTVAAADLSFDHRYSTFQERPDWTVLSATFEPPEQSPEEGREKIRERMDYVDTRERSRPNAGSVFKSAVRLPLERLPVDAVGVADAQFVHRNRICHEGEATYEDVRRLVRRAQLLHALVPGWERPALEWEVWE